MKRTATILAALTASSVMAANTCVFTNVYGDLLQAVTTNKLLLSEIIVTDATASAVTVSATSIAKCGYTAGATICAPEAKLLLAIQQYVDDLKGTLATLATTRDEYIIAQRGNVIKVLDSVRQIYALEDSSIPTAYATIAAAFVSYAEEIAADFSAIVENFDTYQTTRATCMDALLTSQAALLCNAATDAVVTGLTRTDNGEAASYSDAFILELSGKCYDYIQHSATQSSIILTAVYSSGLSSLATALQNIADGDATTAAENFAAAFTAFGKASQSTDVSEKAVSVPTTCTSQATCVAWIEDLFSSTGILDNTKAIQGGEVVSLTFSRVLNEENGNARRLDANGMAVTLASYDFTTDFEKNPGAVDNTENANSALRNGMTACAVAALALLF